MPVTIDLALEVQPLESALLEVQRVEVWPSGRTLFFEGEEPRGIYMIHNGTIDLVFSAKDGRAKALRVASSPQIIGLSSVFSKRLHDYTATVRTTCEVGYVDVATFNRILESSPTIWFSVLKLLSEDVNSCYDCMRDIALAR